MQGRQSYQPQLFYYADVDSLIPQDHLLSKINNAIDLSFVRKLTKPFYCSSYGRPSIDPELFFRMLLISYFYNVSSDRRLCEEIKYNLAYRWFCRLTLEDKVPDHSSLSKIRDRLGIDIFQSFFNQIVEQCQKHGLVKGDTVMTDGTLFAANAALDSLIPREKNRLNTDSTLHKNSQQRTSNKTHVSQTDPEASLAFKRGKARSLKYKAHLTAYSCEEDRTILLKGTT